MYRGSQFDGRERNLKAKKKKNRNEKRESPKATCLLAPLGIFHR